jgi:lysyl-tRNA synthetase class 2
MTTGWKPTAGRRALELRAALNAYLREFFSARDVLEVETPVLSVAGNTDPHIESLRSQFDGPAAGGGMERWLRTSPEYPLKRLLAAGIGDCYELGRVFRNGEAGRRHNPEFTLLEWYRVGWDHVRLMDEVATLVSGALNLVGRDPRVMRWTYRELFRAHAGVDPFEAGDHDLARAVSRFDVRSAALTRDDWLNLILTHRIEPTLDPDAITLVYDYPESQAALARIRQGEPMVAERFEAYVGKYELANGYHELANAAEQRSRFASDRNVRRARGHAEPPLDESLLSALESGLPDCAGVALGVDRLLMAMLGTDDIRDVLAFPFDRA